MKLIQVGSVRSTSHWLAGLRITVAIGEGACLVKVAPPTPAQFVTLFNVAVKEGQ